MRSVSLRTYLQVATMVCVGQLLAGCGGNTDSNPSIPQVAGTYSITESAGAATCTPKEPPAGGIVRLDAFAQTYDVQIDQTGSTLALYEVGHPEVPEAGTIDIDGNILFSGQVSFEETPREGNRVFFVDLAINRELQVQSTSRVTGQALYQNVFHEGSATAAIYATCTREGENELVRKSN
jgi:hypothetical protein